MWGAFVAPVLTYFAVNQQMGFAKPMLYATVGSLIVYVISVYLGPETKGKEMPPRWKSLSRKNIRDISQGVKVPASHPMIGPLRGMGQTERTWTLACAHIHSAPSDGWLRGRREPSLACAMLAAAACAGRVIRCLRVPLRDPCWYDPAAMPRRRC